VERQTVVAIDEAKRQTLRELVRLVESERDTLDLTADDEAELDAALAEIRGSVDEAKAAVGLP
jgi:hypothetical protein